MTRTERVFLVRPSIEEDRPEINFGRPENKKTDWLLVDQVLRGERREEDYPSILVLVDHPEAERWDYYSVAGTCGLMSQRAVDLLEPYALPYFKFFQAWLNGASFFFPKRIHTLDCLDRQRSILVPFRTDPTHVKEIKRYRFRMESIIDPVLFSIPEVPSMFASQTIERLVRERELRGFGFVDTMEHSD